MKTSAQFLGLVILLIAYSTLFSGLPDTVAGIIGALLYPLLVSVPVLPALMAIDKNRPRLEKTALVLNQITLFLTLAASLGLAGKYQSIDALLPFLPPMLIFGGACYLNIVVIRQQIKSRS